MTEPGQSEDNSTTLPIPVARKNLNFNTKIEICLEFGKNSDISYLAKKYQCSEDRIQYVIDHRNIFLKQWRELEPIKSHAAYHTTSFIAIELILAEWLRRARHNRITVSVQMVRRSAQSISGFIGLQDVKYLPIWYMYIEKKYQISKFCERTMTEPDVFSEYRCLSMCFDDIINDVNKQFGENIIFPNGRPKASGTTDSEMPSFDGPSYVAMELILCECMKHARQNRVDITDPLLEQIVVHVADFINFEDFIEISPWIESFKRKYKIATIVPNGLGRKKKRTAFNPEGDGDPTVVIDDIIKDLYEHFGPDIILPNPDTVTTAGESTTCRKKRRTSSPSITVDDSKVEHVSCEVSDWINESPFYIALELILNEWIKRAEHNRINITNFILSRVAQQFTSKLNFDDSGVFKEWLKTFKLKYNLNLTKTNKLLKDDAPIVRMSMISEDIIKDMCDQYGESVILARPGAPKPCPILDLPPATVSRAYTAVLLIVSEWAKRCRHNRFIISEYNLSALIESIASYLICKNGRILLQWTREVKQKFLSPDFPGEMMCPFEVELKPTNVYVIIKDLCKIHGKEKILPDMDVERLTGRKTVTTDDAQKTNTKDNLIKDVDTSQREERTHNVITESEVKVFIIEDCATPATSEIVQMDAVKTDLKLKDPENTDKPVGGISNYQDAVESLQSLEQFLLINEDMRAVGLLNQLENMLKDRIQPKGSESTEEIIIL